MNLLLLTIKMFILILFIVFFSVFFICVFIDSMNSIYRVKSEPSFIEQFFELILPKKLYKKLSKLFKE